jgi:hypothetical protein
MLLIYVLLITNTFYANVHEAKNVFNKYLKAVRANDVVEACSYWNQQEREMYDSLFVDWQLTTLTTGNDLSDLTAEIVSTDKTEDYIELKVEWSNSKNEVVQTDSRYFITEDNRLVCANPILIRSRDWVEKELNYIVYHVRPEEEPDPATVEEIDRFCSEVSESLGITLKRKIHCYKMRDWKEVGEVLNMPPATGRAYVIVNSVLCSTHFPQYEIMHMFRDKFKDGPTATILYRGLGIYLGGTPYFSPHLCTHWAKQVAQKWEMSLAEINETCYSLKPEPFNRTLSLSGALVKYLIEEEGMEKFKKIYLEADDWAGFKGRVKTIYGKDISRIEKEWQEWLINLNTSTIKPGIDPHAPVVFSMSDPEHDDKGDGDYLYPLGREDGIFDLTGFEVLADDDRVYFKFSYRNLTEEKALPEPGKLTCHEWGFKDTFTRVIISTGDESKQTKVVDLKVDQPYNFFIDISGSGILLRNKHAIWLDLLRVKSDQPEIKYGNEIMFSISNSVIGKPTGRWKYQVLSGCRDGRAWMSHGVGFFLTVGKEATEDQGGGGLESELNPNIYDMLVSEGADQSEILASYNESAGKTITVPLVGSN